MKISQTVFLGGYFFDSHCISLSSSGLNALEWFLVLFAIFKSSVRDMDQTY